MQTDLSEQTGTIQSWDDDKGFGFITPNSGRRQIFLHIKNYSRIHRRPVKGLAVIYVVLKDAQGREFAFDACPERGHQALSKAGKQQWASLLLSGAFVSLIAWLCFIGGFPFFILVIVIVMSVIAFGVYTKDKDAAQSNSWRVSENTLHLISLLGGWPGALIAQSFLRHKSSKGSFLFVYWTTALINCCLLAWFLTPKGTAQLNSMMHGFRQMLINHGMSSGIADILF